MRFSTYLFALGALFIPACTFAHTEIVTDERILMSMEQNASQAPAKSQCYLYAQLVHEMIEYSVRQYAAGRIETAAEMLRRSQAIARRVRLLIADDTKKLKETQILLRRAAYRLTDMLHGCSYQDRPLVQETLTQLNEANNDVIVQVFRK